MGAAIDSSEVILLIQQFMKEQGLENSLQALQSETDVSLNAVSSLPEFHTSILNGKWEQVLSHTTSMKITPKAIFTLHEQVALELLEVGDLDVARSLMEQPDCLLKLKAAEPGLFLSIESLIAKANALRESGGLPKLAPSVLFGDRSKQVRRKHVAEVVCHAVSELEPGRLLSLIQEATRWEQIQGTLSLVNHSVAVLDDKPMCTLLKPAASVKRQRLLTGESILSSASDDNAANEEDSFPMRLAGKICFDSNSRAECAAVSWDGQNIVAGGSDGILEVWLTQSCKLRKDVPYQVGSDAVPLMHSKSILSVCFSPDGKMIASGCAGGKIKVWKVSSGNVLRKFSKVHKKGVTCLCFSPDSSQLASVGGGDCDIKVHGLQSGKTIKVFHGHESFVNDIHFVTPVVGGQVMLVSCSSDGSMKVWNPKTLECVATYFPKLLKPSSGALDSAEIMDVQKCALQQIVLVPNSKECDVVVLARSTIFEVVSIGNLVNSAANRQAQARQYMLPECSGEKPPSIVGASVSTHGRFVSALATDNKLYHFDLQENKPNNSLIKSMALESTCTPSQVRGSLFSSCLVVIPDGPGDPVNVLVP